MVFGLAAVVSVYFSSQAVSPEEVAGKIASRISTILAAADRDAQDIQEAIRWNNPTALSGRTLAFYYYRGDSVVQWSDNSYVPLPGAVSDTFRLKLLRSGSSDYLVRKWPIDARSWLIGVLPLYRKYNITNDYLRPSWNTDVFPVDNVSIQEDNDVSGTPVCIQGACPFRIRLLRDELHLHERTSLLAAACTSLSIIFLLVWFVIQASRWPYPDVSFAVLYIAFWLLRWAMTALNFPGVFLHSELFNPQVFASSSLNASLGDLLLNILLVFVLCVYLFRNLYRFRLVRWLQRKPAGQIVLRVVCGVAVLYATLFPFVVVQTLYNNSAIVLDIAESLRFDGLRITALLIILLAGVCSFLFSHAFMRLLVGSARWRDGWIYLLSVGIFLVFNNLTKQEHLSSLVVGTLYILVIWVLKLYKSLKRLGFATFTYLFVTVFCYALNGAYAIEHFNREEKIESQFRFANNFLVERDYFGEYLLRELYQRIAADKFIQTRLLSPFLGKEAIRQKIRQVFLPSYFNKYDVEIYVFNNTGEAVDGHGNVTFSQFISAYNSEAYRTSYDDVFFVGGQSGDFAQKYIVVVPLVRSRLPLGYIAVELTLKKVIPENVYPELLVDNRFQQFYRDQEISYAVFSNTRLLFSSGTLNYEKLFDPAWFGKPELHTEGFTAFGYDHIALEDENARIAIVSSPAEVWPHRLANFSFLFVLGLATILIFILALGAVNYSRGDKLYFSARIQLFLNVAFFLPLIIVSAVTLSVTSRSSRNQINDEYLDKAREVSEQISRQLDEYLSSTDVNTLYFENQLTDLAKLTNLDANVYHASGQLLATSQPLIFENNLVSSYVQADALQRVRAGDNLFIGTEHVGTLEYYVAYAALKASSSGELIGVLAIPFFQSLYSFEKVQINILSNILTIFSVIFIALVVLSYFVSQWLTFPLKFITQSLRRTSLTKVNQPLVWRSDDEIGLMVKEYNQMLYKLSESKAELEQTQRERAWREIAQQVAHEIKNPLTPMKLTLQQLERGLEANTNTPEKTSKAVASLLTQVNTLNDIASSFSAFAKMPEPVIRSLDVVSLLRRVVDLHSHAGNLTLEVTQREVWIDGDEQLLGRTFSNIILNAFQAERAGELLRVQVRAERVDNRVLLAFADNGRGMESDVADRIFVPHFTTKKSGSGLGLAIAKQAIEQMKGRIWFDTTPGRGTTFYIELPVRL